MKKIILSAVLLLVLCCTVLTSCLVPGGGNTPGGNGDDPPTGELMLTKIITPEEDSYHIDYKELKDSYSASADLFLYLFDDADETEGAGELVIGETNRTITATAKSILDQEIKKANNDDEIGYIIYCDGSSVALYWSEHFTRNLCYTYFLDNYVTPGSVTFESGTVKLETMDKSDAKKAQEAIDKQNDFAEVAEILGQEAADALLAHYDLYDERYYIWMANLYDPGTGGFYYSNSALAAEGFLPDLESTQQAFAFFGNAGMYSAYPDGVSEAVPQWMQEQVIEWVRGLQSPEDGYFYHPQWGTDIQPSRQSRDLGWATSCLKQFGASPKWNAPNGVAGEYGKVPGTSATALTRQLTSGATMQAVSLVIPTASLTIDQFPTRLQTIEAWREYIICTMNGNTDSTDTSPNKIRTNSYKIGNDVGAHDDQAIQRDKLGLETGEFVDADKDGIADGGFVETFEELFNSWILDYNGLWEHNKVIDPLTGQLVDDPTGETYYSAINGLMKISAAYNGFGVKFPYAAEALESAVYMINYVQTQSDGRPGGDITGDRPKNSVDVYNPWVCVNSLLSNIKKYGDASEATALQSILQANAVDMIRNTTQKTVHFRKPDGSFSYNWDEGGITSQGAIVRPENANEGDINGGSIAVSGITRNMCLALGLKNIPIYRDSDWDACLEIFESASPIIKNEISAADAVVRDFEDYDIGTAGEEIDCIKTVKMQSGYIEIAEAPASTNGYGDGNALKFVAAKTGLGDTVGFGAGGKGSACYYLEFDIYVDQIEDKTQTLFQISMSKAFRLTINSEKGKDTVYIGDSNAYSDAPISNNLGVYFPVNEWHRIRVEYYYGDAENVRTKIYLDEQLRAESTNYYGKNNGAPSDKYTEAQFYSLNPCLQTTYFDNVCAGKSEQTYVSEPIAMPYLIKDFESDDSLYQTILGTATVVTDPEDKDNHALYINGKTNVSFLGTTLSASPNCFATELAVYGAEMSEGEYFNIYLHGSKTAKAPAVWQIKMVDGELSVYEVKLVGGAEQPVSAPIAEGLPSDEWVTLRFEYYRYQYDEDYTYCNSIIYTRDGDSYREIGRGTAYYDINNMRQDYNYCEIVSGEGCSVYIDNVMPTKEYIVYVDENGRDVEDTDVPFPSGAADVANPGTPVDHDGFFDFEDAVLGQLPGFSADMNSDAYGNDIQIVDDPTGADHGKVLEMTTVKGDSGNSTIYDFSRVNTSGNCYVLEYQAYFDYVSGDKSIQCFFRDASNKNIAACTFQTSVNDAGYSITIYGKSDTASTSLKTVSVGPGWVTFRVEYYHDVHMTKIYVNGNLEVTTDMYYESYTGGDVPSLARIFSLSGAISHYYLDNVTAQVLDKEYQ